MPLIPLAACLTTPPYLTPYQIDLESEEDDRVKYRDQLEVIGCMARLNTGAVLPYLSTMLMERCRAVKETADSQQECTPVSTAPLGSSPAVPRQRQLGLSLSL